MASVRSSLRCRARTTVRAIWETLDASGPLRTKQIAETVGVTTQTARVTNNVLIGLGAIAKVGHGTYTAVEGWCPWAQTPEQITRTISDGIDTWEYSGTRAECVAEQHRADHTRISEQRNEIFGGETHPGSQG